MTEAIITHDQYVNLDTIYVHGGKTNLAMLIDDGVDSTTLLGPGSLQLENPLTIIDQIDFYIWI